jgi:hypothetical protein
MSPQTASGRNPFASDRSIEDIRHAIHDLTGDDYILLGRMSELEAAVERDVLDALEAAVRALPPVINSAPWHYIDRAAVLEAIQQQRSKP